MPSAWLRLQGRKAIALMILNDELRELITAAPRLRS